MSGPSLTDRAIVFAARSHRHQLRKSSDTPYITHPFGVAMLLERAGCEEKVVVAGLLHDTLEDTDTTERELAQLFGTDVLDFVKGCSEPDKSLSWEERKNHTINALKLASIPICLITCADKLHNLRTLYEDEKELGETLWNRFARGKDKQKWYYTSILETLRTRIDGHPLFQALEEEITAVF